MNDKPRIVATLPLEPEFEARLAAAGEIVSLVGAPREQVFEALATAQAFLGHYPVDGEFLDAGPALRVVATSSVGYDFIDVAAASARGVAVCNTPGVLTAAVADLTVALILMLSRRLLEFERYARSGAWARREPMPALADDIARNTRGAGGARAACQPMPALAHDIAGKTVGVVGFGRIGREVTRRMLALGMKALWYDIFDNPPPDAPAAPRRTLDDLLREADVVSIHMDLNDSSRHLIGEREIALMRGNAYLVNTARGGVVDQAALTAALQENRIAGAGLDVLAPEPPDPDDPILSLPNVVIFPHMATATHETRKAMRGLAVDNVIAVLAGQRPQAIVNPEVLESQ